MSREPSFDRGVEGTMGRDQCEGQREHLGKNYETRSSHERRKGGRGRSKKGGRRSAGGGR